MRAVYDSVLNRAELAAEEFEADCCSGLITTIERSDVRALLLLDSAWQGWTPLRLICSRGKPTYIAGSLGENVAELRKLHESACAASLTLMPEFSRRYTPATGRLQELLATCLGRPQRIEIEATAPRPDDSEVVPGQGPGRDFLIGLIDWCRHIVRTNPLRVHAERLNGAESGSAMQRVSVRFAEFRSGGLAPAAELQLAEPPPSGDAGAEPPPPGPRFRVECERGWALIESPAEITWSAGEQPISESLVSERSEVEVMLDHFCRRVAGGLIPLADVEDVCRTMALVLAAEESLRDRRPISLNGQPL